MNVFVHSTSSFIQQSEVADGASEILYEILGLDRRDGIHVHRSACTNFQKMHLLKSTSFLL